MEKYSLPDNRYFHNLYYFHIKNDTVLAAEALTCPSELVKIFKNRTVVRYWFFVVVVFANRISLFASQMLQKVLKPCPQDC